MVQGKKELIWQNLKTRVPIYQGVIPKQPEFTAVSITQQRQMKIRMMYYTSKFSLSIA